MTGAFEPEIADRIVEMGAVTCMKKPFTPEDLRSALAMVGVEVD
jgi:hypothetical protein